jgi:hypothetical protein
MIVEKFSKVVSRGEKMGAVLPAPVIVPKASSNG